MHSKSIDEGLPTQNVLVPGCVVSLSVAEAMGCGVCRVVVNVPGISSIIFNLATSRLQSIFSMTLSHSVRNILPSP